MAIWLIGLVTWFALGTLVALVIGKGIKMMDPTS